MIYFPTEYTTISSGVCKSYLLPEDGSIYVSAQSLTCTFITVGNYFKIKTVELKGSEYQNHTIFIEDIRNPAAGGTGFFKIETRRGDLNILDYNHNFQPVGILGDPKYITVSSYSRSKSKVNDVSNYSFTVTTLTQMPKNGSVYIFIRDGTLKFMSDSECSTTLSITVKCVFLNEYYVKFSVYIEFKILFLI